MTRVWWTRLPAGDGRVFLYSPRFGCTYLLEPELATSRVLPVLLGLSSRDFLESLVDPATAVALTGAFEKPLVVSPGMEMERGRNAPALLTLLYVFFHRLRRVATIPRATRLAVSLVKVRGVRLPLTLSEIGLRVMAVERSLGISDCYPRALLTAYLCLTAGLRCEITVGILAPTAKMHAWCSTDGVIPFEPVTRHWWYSPLVVVEVAG